MSKKNYKLDWGLHGLVKLLADYEFETVLDIGSGQGEHSRLMRDCGRTVKSVYFFPPADYVGDFFEVEINEQFDAIWCSHVLEHQRNVGAFLERLYGLLKPNGVLAVIVPIHPPERLVAGHLTAWSAYLLVYNLVLAGFDCKEARILHTYELSLIVEKTPTAGVNHHNSTPGAEAGDMLKNLEQYFPMPAKQGMTPRSGNFQLGWGEFYPALPFEVEITSKNINGGPVTIEGVQDAA